MSTHRPYQGISDAQADANAAALARRGSPYSGASGTSFNVKWDWRKRQPRTLHEAVDMCRRLYAEEPPMKLHSGVELADDGTPKMTAQAEGYIFGDDRSDDAPRNPETGERDPIGYYHAPFRARLAEMSQDRDERTRKRAAIVSHVTIGAQGPSEAAMTEGVPSWCASEVAEKAILAFLHSMSDVKLHLSHGGNIAEGVTAA